MTVNELKRALCFISPHACEVVGKRLKGETMMGRPVTLATACDEDMAQTVFACLCFTYDRLRENEGELYK